MISFEDRMALVRAGYNASQIAEFDTAPSTQTETQQAHQTETKTETQTETQTEHQTETQPADFAAMMQSLNKSLSATVAAMQAQNIKTANMRESEKESPSDILAKLLNP